MAIWVRQDGTGTTGRYLIGDNIIPRPLQPVDTQNAPVMMQCWLYRQTDSGSNKRVFASVVNTNGSLADRYSLIVTGADLIGCEIENDAGGSRSVNTGVSSTTGVWYHVLAVFRTAAGSASLHIWVDGVEVNSTTHPLLYFPNNGCFDVVLSDRWSLPATGEVWRLADFAVWQLPGSSDSNIDARIVQQLAHGKKRPIDIYPRHLHVWCPLQHTQRLGLANMVGYTEAPVSMTWGGTTPSSVLSSTRGDPMAVRLARNAAAIAAEDEEDAILALLATTFEQEGYRWRDDDAGEAAATWLANQDTNVSIFKGENVRLRVLTNVSGDPASVTRTLQYRKVGDSTWITIGTV